MAPPLPVLVVKLNISMLYKNILFDIKTFVSRQSGYKFNSRAITQWLKTMGGAL